MQAVRHDDGQPAFRSRWLFVANGFYYIIAALGLGVACYLMPSFAGMIVDNNMADIDDLPGAVRWMMDHRIVLSFTALPMLGCGVILVATTKLKWVWTIIGLFAAIVPLAVVMWCFIAAMSLLYNPPPL